MIKDTIDTKEITFWNFLKENCIEIPIIQRDYAQGRLGKEHFRRGFLSDIKAVLDNDDKNKMKLDFVYGFVENDRFSPLDGQQRLTTLWLLHWYIALISGNLNKDICDVLKKFTYETRISSREFCMNLCKPENFEKYGEYKKEDDRRIVDFITNATWFYSEWKQDPTIQSMLRMLGGTKVDDKKGNDIIDGLEEVFRTDKKIEEYWESLTSETAPIVFYQLSLNNLVSSDDLYIKMNARGKQLTPFENFKADLIGFLKNEKNNDGCDLLDEENGIPIKLDTSWTDIFWWNKFEDRIDDIYFAFLNRFFLSELVSQNTISGDLEKDVTFCYLYGDESDDSFVEYVGWDKYKGVTKNHLIALKNVLDHYPQKEEIEKYFPEWVSSISDMSFIPKYKEKNKIITLNQKERVVFHAITKYLKKGDFDRDSFKKWMRVVWNIVENATINGVPGMIGAMRLIEELGEHSHEIYDFLRRDNGNKIKSEFAHEQVKEEIEKAKQIINEKGEIRKYERTCKRKDGSPYDTWEEIIIDAEKYAFFKGAIRFLFQDGNGWDDFDKKWENAKKYFGPDGVKDGVEPNCMYKTNSLLMKCLLANCDDFQEKVFYHFEFSNDALIWRRILLSDKWRNSVDVVLKSDNFTTEETVKNIKNENIKNIVDDGLMDFICNERSGACIRKTYHNYYALWQNRYPSYQVVINPILSQLAGKEIEYNEKNKIPNCRYYKCENKNVEFKYKKDDKDYYFQWYGNPNEKELDVYLMEIMENERTDYKKRSNPTNGKGTDEDNYYCFRVSSEMVENTTQFTDELDNLIKQVNSDNESVGTVKIALYE